MNLTNILDYLLGLIAQTNEMYVPLWIAIVSMILAPVMLSYLTNRQRRAEKREDWKRQDEVARRLEIAQKDNTHRLDEIHTLVNSDMTAARQSELNQTRLTLATMRKVVAISKTPPSPEDLAAIESTESRILELETIIADRLAKS